MTLLSTATIEKERSFDPQNIVKLSNPQKRKQTKPPYRLFILIANKHIDTFTDEPGESWGRGYWVENVSESDFLFKQNKTIDWAMKQSNEVWEQWKEDNAQVNNRLLESVGFDPNDYYIHGISTVGFAPAENVYDIKN